uniref:Uncharacterized protein n=1 Tax=Rhabditophanes sp. KR3021 TaxID=114890 RepID=A0AC35TJ99_9BILA
MSTTTTISPAESSKVLLQQISSFKCYGPIVLLVIILIGLFLACVIGNQKKKAHAASFAHSQFKDNEEVKQPEIEGIIVTDGNTGETKIAG